MTAPNYYPMFPLAKDQTSYRRLQVSEAPQTVSLGGQFFLKVSSSSLTELARAAMRDINFYLRPGHLAQLRAILDDGEASPNDRYVAFDLLKNANIAAAGILPMCQDTGTAIIQAKRGFSVLSDGNDEAALNEGVRQAYFHENLRYSQVSPLSMFQEQDTRNNLPAQIDLLAEAGDAYKFLFIAKGGGSANKSFLYQETPSLLEESRMLAFLEAKMRLIGTSACPPYHLAVVIGGTSAELTMKTVKLASCRYLDGLPTSGGAYGQAYRDCAMEAKLLEISRQIGIGAQFGGKYYCHDVRVIRLPRHGASLPIGMAVSCSADRQALAKISEEGVFLEALETEPARFLPEAPDNQMSAEVVKIDLNRPMPEVLAKLSQYPIRTRLALSGTIIVARDSAHRRLRERLAKGEALPDYFRNHPIYYAGPAKTPEGMVSGSFGPTTAGRMDSFVEEFQAQGASLIMLAKGNRSAVVRKSCQKYGGFYLGSIGGPAARLAQDCIRKLECIEFPELGMEAIWRIEVEDFPAFIVIDDKGNDFFQQWEG